MMSIKDAILIPTLVLTLFSSLNAQQEDFLSFGYLPAYRFHLIDSINLDQLTHLIVAFGNPNRMGKFDFEGQNIGPIIRKAKKHQIKVLLSFGGRTTAESAAAWDYWLKPWNRSQLINEMRLLVQRHQVDGIDIDLEGSDVPPHYSDFILDTKRMLNARQGILTVALPAKKRYPVLNDSALKAIDYLLLMAYDLRGPFRPDDPGQHSPLFFAERSIAFWKSEGVPSQKIVLGLPLYGWEFASSGRVYSVSYGFLVARDSSLAQKDRVDNIFYNGLPTIEAKTKLAMEKAGGVMFWELGQDAFNEMAILNKVYQTIHQPSLEISEEEIITTTIIEEPPLVASTDIVYAEEEVDYNPPPTQKTFLINALGKMMFVHQGLEGEVVVKKIPEYPTGLYVLHTLLESKLIQLPINKVPAPLSK